MSAVLNQDLRRSQVSEKRKVLSPAMGVPLPFTGTNAAISNQLGTDHCLIRRNESTIQ
jgi:hypothetical protein